MSVKKDTLIVTPMEKEHDAFLKGLAPKERRLEAGVMLSTIGIGKVNAATSVAALVQLARPDIRCVVSVGCAGALAPKLNIGDVVVCTESCYWDVYCGEGNEKGQVQGMPPTFPAEQSLVRRIASAIRKETDRRVWTGPMLTGDKFFEAQGSEMVLHEEFPRYLTVDMETAAIAQACFRLNLPYASVRVISDAYGADRGAQYSAFWKATKRTGFDFASAVMKAVSVWRKRVCR